jgi:cell division septation protein DedD
VASTKHTLLIILLCSTLISGITGCGSSSESSAENIPEPASSPVQKQGKPKSSQHFTVQADTLHATSRKKDGSAAGSIEIRKHVQKKYYSVQIGAFKSETNIKQNQKLLEQRFQQPVIVFFEKGISLTRMCVGKFSSEDEAVKFLRSMQQQFPNDYNQAWVAALKQ